MDEQLVIAHWHEPVGTALGRLEEPAAAVVVVDGDRVVAVVERPVLARWVDEAPSGGTPIHLRDRVSPPVWYCRTGDDLAAARSTLARAETGAIAVVNPAGRVVGVLTAGLLPATPTAPGAGASADATDRSEQPHPGLEVYAPWATIQS